MSKPKIVILGAGYGGMITSKNLENMIRKDEADITLINKHDYHYITTLLHKIGAGTSKDRKVALPIRELIDSSKINFKKDTVTSMDFDNQTVHLASGEIVNYDYLVASLGFEIETFGTPGVDKNAFSLRSFRTAKKTYHHIEKQFSLYKQDQDPSRLTFTVAGAGFTGIELIGELVVQLPKLAKKYDIPYKNVRILNVEASPDLLPGFGEEATDYTTELLYRMGVEIITNNKIIECKEKLVRTDKLDIKTHTLVWSCGVRGHKLFDKAGQETSRGKLPVDSYLRSKDYDNVFCIGDNALFMQNEDTPLPPTAQVAMQQAPVCAGNIVAAIRKEEPQPFVYNHKGSVASISNRYAVGKVGNLTLKGKTAALMKHAIESRYLYFLGGSKLVTKQLIQREAESANVPAEQGTN